MTSEIDAHQHFWRRSEPFDYTWLDEPDMAPIRHDFMPEQLEALLRDTPVRRTVFIQTQHDVRENRWALELAERHDFIAGVVGWVDLASPACEEQLLEFAGHPKFVGIRHVTQSEPEDFLLRADVLRGLAVLQKHRIPFDLLLYVKHLRHLPALARQLGELPLVIDHLAKPKIGEGGLGEWLPHLQAAAAFPNVSCKLSGLVTEADWRTWTVEDLKPYVRTALEAFGPRRCMFGSDWPVCQLAASYRQVYEALNEALGPIGASERQEVFGGTARRFYGLA